MLTLRKLTEAEIIKFLIAQRGLPFSYSELEMTRSIAPQQYDVARYDIDRHRVYLGQGVDVYRKAKEAIKTWKMFPHTMAQLYWTDAPIEKSTVVAVLFRAAFLWSLNPCRVVYVVDETCESDSSNIEKYGFAYGTLEDHLERGEERFLVEHHLEDDLVCYEIYVISQPRHWLARIAYSVIRYQQRRFRKLSGQAMKKAVETESRVACLLP